MRSVPPAQPFGQPPRGIPPQPVPIIGQQQASQAQAQAHMQAAISQAIQQLSMGIYAQLATARISIRDDHQAVEPDRFRQLAKDSLVAARAYFEGIGIIEQEASGNGQT